MISQSSSRGIFASAISGLLLFGCAAGISTSPSDPATSVVQPELGVRDKALLRVDGLNFKDLNGDGKLNEYEDWRLSESKRLADLIGRMTLAEKAGQMMHGSLIDIPGEGGVPIYLMPNFEAALERHVSSFGTRLAIPSAALAERHNTLQAKAEATRLGIPLTISSDPRHHFHSLLGTSATGGDFSRWPDPLGFAALGDPAVVKQFADIARREYRAVGLHMALSPQADLATEPRWPRQIATFGAHAHQVNPLVGAYVRGFQGSDTGLTPDGVATVTKHWAGYAAAVDGFDAHNYYGRFVDLSEDTMAEHMRAFDDALAADTAGIMPSYALPQGAQVNGVPLELIGAGYSVQMLKEQLRERREYDGLILSDWAIIRDCGPRCKAPTAQNQQDIPQIATSWGTEKLSVYDRFVLGVRAGLDQFGGEEDGADLVRAVRQGDLDEARIDASVARVLALKFRMGLFENPYVDAQLADRIAGSSATLQVASQTQRAAQVLLKNKNNLLPLSRNQSAVWAYGFDSQVLRDAGLEVVSNPADADVAIIRADAPREMLHPHHFFGRLQDEGRLDFRDGDPAYDALRQASATVPTVFALFLDRAAVLPNVAEQTTALLGHYGADDAALLDVMWGRAKPQGRLPVELPSSMDAVSSQHPGIPNDSDMPLFPAGSGLDYP